MKIKLLILLLIPIIQINCTWVNPKLGYISILQNKSLDASYNPETNNIAVKYNIDNQPAIQAMKTAADIYTQGYTAALKKDNM